MNIVQLFIAGDFLNLAIGIFTGIYAVRIALILKGGVMSTLSMTFAIVILAFVVGDAVSIWDGIADTTLFQPADLRDYISEIVELIAWITTIYGVHRTLSKLKG